MLRTPKITDRPGRILAAVIASVATATMFGCETRVISASGIGSERYDIQPTFEEEYRLFPDRDTSEQNAYPHDPPRTP
ncbi:MAG: hypothetical protein KAS72_14750 [Phycisphaerales bacterium]|nr:hypothetical protein [Phycisphaerales bacterium]